MWRQRGDAHAATWGVAARLLRLSLRRARRLELRVRLLHQRHVVALGPRARALARAPVAEREQRGRVEERSAPAAAAGRGWDGVREDKVGGAPLARVDLRLRLRLRREEVGVEDKIIDLRPRPRLPPCGRHPAHAHHRNRHHRHHCHRQHRHARTHARTVVGQARPAAAPARARGRRGWMARPPSACTRARTRAASRRLRSRRAAAPWPRRAPARPCAA